MPTDVIIDPNTGQIYWNNGGGGLQESISIKGDALNAISFVGYGVSYSPGSTPSGTTLLSVNDGGGTDALIPGTSGFNLGSSTLRWNTFSSNANLSGTLVVSDSTISSSLLTGSVKFNGGIAISGNASIGQSLNFYNTSNLNYVGFKAGVTAANTLYILPTGYPGAGTSFLQSDTTGTLAWIGSIGTATTAQNINVVNATTNSAHPLHFSPSATGSGLATSSNTTLSYNPSSFILSVSGLAVTNTTASLNTTTGALVVTGGVGIGGSIFTASTSKSSISGVSFNNSRAENGFTINASSSYTFNIQDTSNNQRLNYHGDSNRTDFTGNTATHEIRLIHSNNSGYTGLKSNSSGTVTYTFPAGDGTNGQALTTNGLATLSWATITGGGAGTVAIPNAQYTLAYYAGTGASVSSANLITVVGTGVTILGATNASSTTVAALSILGGLGITGNAFIGGTINVASTSASVISGISFVNGAITVGAWNGTVISSTYGGTGLNNSGQSGILKYTTGTGSLVAAPTGAIVGTTDSQALTNKSYNNITVNAPASSATLTLANNSSLITSGGHSLTFNTTATTSVTLPTTGTLATTSNKLSDFAATTSLELFDTITGETGSGALVFATSPDFTTSVATVSTTFGVFNTTATTINAFGAATAMSIGAATGKATFNSTDNSSSTTTGSLAVSGGAGIAKSVSIGGRLQMFNGANFTAFVSSASGNTVYTLPTTSPATGSSVLQSTSGGVMSWVPMTSGGSASPGGVDDGSVQFKSGSSFGGTSGLKWNDVNKYLQVTGYPGEEPSAATQAALLIEQTLGTFSGSINGNIIGANALSGFTGFLIELQLNGGSKFRVQSTGAVTFANAFTFPTTDGSANQVLQTNGSGSVSWATVTGSSGAGSGTVAIPGAQYQVAAYYSGTGASVSGSTTFTNNISTGVVNITHATESTSSTTGALTITGGAGIAKSLFVGTTLSVGQAPGYAIPNNLASFVSTVDSYNQLVIQNKSSGTSASANLVVNNNSSTDAANYGEIGMNSSTFTGSGALSAPNAVYIAAHTAPLVIGTVTSHPIRFVVNSGATDILFIQEAGTAISVFTNLDLRSQNDIRFFNSGNTFNTALQAGSNTVNYTLSLPTAPVGAGSSVIVTGSDGQMYFAAPGSGIAFSTAVTNLPTIRAKRPIALQFSAGYTPAAAGADTVILRVPESATDGTTALTYNLRRFQVRVETPSAGSSRLQLERSSTDTGAFTLAATGSSHIGGLGVTIVGAGIYLTSVTTFSGSLVTSGNLLRLSWTLLNATHASFSVQLLLEEV